MVSLDEWNTSPVSHRLDALPVAKRLFGYLLTEVTLQYLKAGVEPWPPPTIIISVHMRFESIQVFMEARSRIGEQLARDIPNCTKVSPVIQLSRIIPFE